MTAAEFAQRLHGRRSGLGWMARCPAHDDRSPSLSIRPGRDGRTLIYCFAGCEKGDILRAAGLEWADLFPPDSDRPQRRAARPQRPQTTAAQWAAWCAAFLGGKK